MSSLKLSNMGSTEQKSLAKKIKARILYSNPGIILPFLHNIQFCLFEELPLEEPRKWYLSNVAPENFKRKAHFLVKSPSGENGSLLPSLLSVAFCAVEHRQMISICFTGLKACMNHWCHIQLTVVQKCKNMQMSTSGLSRLVSVCLWCAFSLQV